MRQRAMQTLTRNPEAGPQRPPLSIIIPTLNEAATIGHCLQALQSFRQRGCELILVDGGSSDTTLAQAARLVDRVLVCAPGRAIQMNMGAAVAMAPILVFLHADTSLPGDADRTLTARVGVDDWGRFDVRLDGRHPAFRLIEWCINLRSRCSGIATGDQVLFIGRRLFGQAGGFPVVPLMEDVRISAVLRRIRAPICLRARVLSSSRRWHRHGIAATVIRMWCLRFAHALGVSPDRLVRFYY